MDFGEILKSLPRMVRRAPEAIAPDDLVAKARAMAKRGYNHSETSLRALEAYMQGFGVLLSGGIGIGKTMFFEVVNPEPIAVLSFNQCHLWNYEQLERWLVDHSGQEIVLDDIGWGAEARNYGQKYESLQVALDFRLNGGPRTHITTNLTNDELCQRFDGHLVDRIYQLCRCFAYPSGIESKREADINYTYIRNINYAKKTGRLEL